MVSLTHAFPEKKIQLSMLHFHFFCHAHSAADCSFRELLGVVFALNLLNYFAILKHSGNFFNPAQQMVFQCWSVHKMSGSGLPVMSSSVTITCNLETQRNSSWRNSSHSLALDHRNDRVMFRNIESLSVLTDRWIWPTEQHFWTIKSMFSGKCFVFRLSSSCVFLHGYVVGFPALVCSQTTSFHKVRIYLEHLTNEANLREQDFPNSKGRTILGVVQNHGSLWVGIYGFFKKGMFLGSYFGRFICTQYSHRTCAFFHFWKEHWIMSHLFLYMPLCWVILLWILTPPGWSSTF